MRNYQSPEWTSRLLAKHFPEEPTPAVLPLEPAPLVNRYISQRSFDSKNTVKSLLVYPRSVKLVRDFKGKKPDNPPALRSEISSFSAKSKSRLKFTSANAFPSLITQFGMTYHKTCPDGRTVKKHLNQFLTELRFKHPGVKHLWILEFQSRGTAHFHIFLSLEHSKKLGKELGEIWHRIAEPDSKQHLQFHQHEKNFIKWDMGSGSYLCKYLDKESQKCVPSGFTGVGRFWGSSRGLVPEPDQIEASDLNAAFSYETTDEKTGEIVKFNACKHVVRTLCRHHEKALRNSPWQSSARKRPTCYMLPNSANILRILENWMYQEKQKIIPF